MWITQPLGLLQSAAAETQEADPQVGVGEGVGAHRAREHGRQVGALHPPAAKRGNHPAAGAAAAATTFAPAGSSAANCRQGGLKVISSRRLIFTNGQK